MWKINYSSFTWCLRLFFTDPKEKVIVVIINGII